jgi:hypothetical protein
MAEEEKKPDQATEESKEEKLFAGKYKSAEELEKAYKESEKMAHEKAQKAAEVEKQLKELQEKEEETVTPEPETELENYEYLTKADMSKLLEKQKKELEEQRKKDREELLSFVDARSEIDKIRAKHPELTDATIQQVVALYPDETEFDVALSKHREQTAKELGLHTEVEVKTKEVNIPSNLIGVQDFGVETEDRSRIKRIREAGNAGKMPLQKK